LLEKLKNKHEESKILYKFSILRSNLEYKYEDISDEKNKNDRLKIKEEDFLLIIKNHRAIPDLKYPLITEIIDEAYSLIEAIIKNLNEQDDLMNYMMLISSKINFNLQNKPVFTFDNFRSLEDAKKEILNSLFSEVVVYQQDSHLRNIKFFFNFF